MSEGGNSLDESIGLITAANEVVNDPSSVGTALKTLTLRLRGSKTELEEMGEDVTDMATTTSQLQAKLLALTGGQVDIMVNPTTFKNSTQILREMADAWEDMNDIQRASALELMGGKRQANVLSALIQNFDTVEKVIETSANSAGSALEENERYLDSIQGKIDQFNNAMQAMWSNTLDSDIVKWFIGLGTELVKIVDAIGLIPSILTAILTYKLAIGAIKMFDLGSLGTYISLLFTANSATEVQGLLINKNALAQKLMNSTLVQAQAARMGLTAADLAGYSVTQLLTLGVKGLAAGFKNLWIAIGPVGWTILAIVGASTALTLIFNAAHKTTEELAEELSNLKSELSDVESEIDSLNSELETTKDRMAELLALPSLSFVEQEELANLKQTTAELERQLKLKEMLAGSKKDAITTASEKYINRAWNSNNLDKTYAISNGVIKEDGFWDIGVNTKDALNQAMSAYKNSNDVYNTMSDALANWDELSDYDKYALTVKAKPGTAGELVEEENWIKAAHFNQIASKNDVEQYLQDAEDHMIDIAEGVNMVFSDENFADLKYGMSDDINAFLDELYAYQYKWQEAQGISAKSSAIASIFDDTSSDGIKKLKKDLSEIAGDDTLDAAKKQESALDLVNEAISNTTGEYDRLKTSMDIIGITADEVARYFTQMSSMPDSSTVEGLTAQYQKGVDALGKYKGVATDIIAEFTDLDGTVEQITWESLFDDEGEAIDTQISKVLQGTDETARTEFARIAKAVNEGTMSVETAMSSFSGSGLVAVSKLIEESFGELNKSVFKGLEDEISGFIDTFSEFSAALEDVANSMDLLHTAQEQYNNSGQVSVKTALELMQSTDQWNKILTVENGKITLNTEAQDILVQSKLNTVKANLAEAKASIQNQLAQLGAADATLLSAEASDITTEAYTIYTNAMNSYTASIAGFGAALDALVNGRIFGNDGIIGSFKSAYDATKQVTTYENNTNIAALREKLAEVDQMEDFFEGVDTFDEFANNYDFDETPGDKYGNDEDSKTDEKMDAFQKEMDYWENRIGANQARYEQLQNEIDLLETKGQKADASYYDEQIKLENQRLFLLGEQKKAAEAYLATLAEGSEEWWEVANTLNDIESELDDVTASIVDLQDAIGEIDTYKFEEFNTRLDDITSKLETIRDLIAPDGEEDWFDDEGNWTESGVAVLGSYLQELETYKQGYTETVDELEKYAASYKGNEAYYEALGIHSEQEWYDKTEELISQQYDFAESISDTEQSVVDMYESSIDAIEEYTETLIDGYKDYIDSVKEALDAERNLYNFKKNVQKQTKDIAALERRIASLSGSTNASDIAERRRLEADLYGAREELDDTYYDHAKTTQQEALDNEAAAYEETMTRFIDGLRASLDQATTNMDEFLMSVTSMVTLNADTVLTKYQETELPLGDAITNPWEAAKAAVGNYSGDALDLMNKWTQGGFFTTFPETVEGSLTSPWSAGSTAASAFKTSVSTVMSNVVSNISTNVKTASEELSKLYQQIKDTEQRATNANVTPNKTVPKEPVKAVIHDADPAPTLKPTVKLRGLMKTSREMILGPKSFVDANTETINGTKYYRDSKTGYYYKISDLNSKRKYDGGRTIGWSIPKGTWFYTKNAKGTTGTKRDEWGLTDEPQFGDELVLIPTPQGNLSYMRKGTGVVPADLTANLMEWGQFTPDSMNLGGGVNVNMINNAVNKPEFNFAFDALVKAENITEETLPAVKKLVTQELNRFTKELNYALKGKGAR